MQKSPKILDNNFQKKKIPISIHNWPWVDNWPWVSNRPKSWYQSQKCKSFNSNMNLLTHDLPALQLVIKIPTFRALCIWPLTIPPFTDKLFQILNVKSYRLWCSFLHWERFWKISLSKNDLLVVHSFTFLHCSINCFVALLDTGQISLKESSNYNWYSAKISHLE